ncbi:SDR family oxidoreductase [Actinocorallia lasiicapitis]
MRTALVTGASRGLGLALATRLHHDGWHVVTTARSGLPPFGTPLHGDVTDSWHRAGLAEAVDGGLDLLVNNAGTLGAVPLPPLATYPLADLHHALDVNVIAPLALTQLLLPALRERGGAILNLTSDAAVEGYPGWGGYGATKAALDQLTRVLAAEEPKLAVWSVDPGEMNTRMLADAGEAVPEADIASAPEPSAVVPALLRLVASRGPSGRYRAREL